MGLLTDLLGDGSAGGGTLHRIGCPAKMMDTSNGSAAYSFAALGTAGSRIACQLLDGAALEGVAGWVVIPSNWESIDVYVRWGVPTANAGDVVWQVQYQLIGAGTTLVAETNGSQITATAAAQNVVTDTRVATALAVGSADTFKFDMLRRADVAGDTLNAVDIGLVEVYITEAS